MLVRSGEVINLNHLSANRLPVFSDEEAESFQNKGWNLPQIWDLVFLKTVFITISQSNERTKQDLYLKLSSASRPIRLVDEYFNALKCFGVIDYGESEFKIIQSDFFEGKPTELTERDVNQLKHIFFSYFRFKEISNWLLKNTNVNEGVLRTITQKSLVESSFPIFCTSFHQLTDKESNRKRKLTDTIFYEPQPMMLLRLDKTQDKMMRFFDVYINWGLKLKLIESLNLTDGVNVTCSFARKSRLKAFYFINDEVDIDISTFIDTHYRNSTRIISLPELTINLAIWTRCSIKKIHNEILSQTANSNGMYSLQRTSKVFIAKDRDSPTFIRDREKLYPKLGNAFISHIILR